MASAIQLNAQATILSSTGLGANVSLLNNITTFRSKYTVTTIVSLYSTATSFASTYSNANLISGNVSDVVSSLSGIGSGVTAPFLLDRWPANIAPVCSPSAGGISNSNSLSFSTTIRSQALLPFANGYGGFANVVSKASSFASENFDTIASLNILQNKTYAGSGIGYTGSVDLATGGIGDKGTLLASVVANWGTMYDVSNINLINDPYVFGQNLLNQGFGSLGGLESKLTAAGLDTSDITKIPATVTTIDTSDTGLLVTHPTVGAIELPGLTNVSTTNTVLANSPEVVMSIYRSITGDDLATIVAATKIIPEQPSKVLTLADYLDFNKVASVSNLQLLSALQIKSFSEFSKYLNSRLKSATFLSWSAMATFLQAIEVPAQTYSTFSKTDPVLVAGAAALLNAGQVSGSGPLNNPAMADYYGATAGIPFTEKFKIINDNYPKIASPIETLVATLNTAVNTWITNFIASATIIPDPESGLDSTWYTAPSTSAITAAVTALNSGITAISNSTEYQQSAIAYFNMLDKLSNEVTNLTAAGVIFGPDTEAQILKSFAQSFVRIASDKREFLSYDVFVKLMANDVYGDRLRASLAEENNISLLNSVGINVHNDPQPAFALYQAQSQGISITTYLNQNQ